MVEATITAEYYFGGAVTEGSIEVLIHRRPFWHHFVPPRAFPWFHEDPVGAWRSWGGPGELVETGLDRVRGDRGELRHAALLVDEPAARLHGAGSGEAEAVARLAEDVGDLLEQIEQVVAVISHEVEHAVEFVLVLPHEGDGLADLVAVVPELIGEILRLAEVVAEVAEEVIDSHGAAA